MISKVAKKIPYKYIIFLSMLFVSIDLSAVAVAYRMVSLNSILQFNSGATYIFPLTYCLGDIITEVYGYKLARNLIWYSLFLQFLYAVLITIVIHMPVPTNWVRGVFFQEVFGETIRFIIAGTVANIASNFINIYLVSKLKIPFEGKLFWLRSIASTVISGFTLSALIVLIAFMGSKSTTSDSFIMFKSTFALEIIYAIILAFPAHFIAKYLKKSEGVDVYDLQTNFNPFNLLNLET